MDVDGEDCEIALKHLKVRDFTSLSSCLEIRHQKEGFDLGHQSYNQVLLRSDRARCGVP